MNKQDLIAAVADSSGLTKGDASKAVEAVFDSITGALKKGGEVRLVMDDPLSDAAQPLRSGTGA
jgi:DNA-binding protein HU-beta